MNKSSEMMSAKFKCAKNIIGTTNDLYIFSDTSNIKTKKAVHLYFHNGNQFLVGRSTYYISHDNWFRITVFHKFFIHGILFAVLLNSTAISTVK